MSEEGNNIPMTDVQSGIIINHMAHHSMLAAHQMIGNDAKTTRILKLEELKAKVDLKGAKKSVKQIVNHWNNLRYEAKDYNANEAIFRKLTGNPVESTVLRDDKHEDVLSVVGTSHKNGLSLANEMGLPKVNVIQVAYPAVQSLCTSKKRPTLNSVMKNMQKENKTVITKLNNSSLQPVQVYLLPAQPRSNNVRQTLSKQVVIQNSNVCHPQARASSILTSISPVSSRINTCQSSDKIMNSNGASNHLTNSLSSTNKLAAVSILKPVSERLSAVNVRQSLVSQHKQINTGGVLHPQASCSSSSKSAVSILKSNRPLKNQPSIVPVVSSSLESMNCVDTVKKYSRNQMSDIGFSALNQNNHGLNIDSKSKQILKKRNRTTAHAKTQVMSLRNAGSYGPMNRIDSITKSMRYTQYGNLMNSRSRMSSVLAEAVVQNTESFNQIQNELRIANELKREELAMQREYYNAQKDKSKGDN